MYYTLPLIMVNLEAIYNLQFFQMLMSVRRIMVDVHQYVLTCRVVTRVPASMYNMNSVLVFGVTCNSYRTGFTLLADKRTCADVNECEENPRICNGGQCNNTIGSFLCTCSDGLLRGEDGSSCLGNRSRLTLLNFF